MAAAVPRRWCNGAAYPAQAGQGAVEEPGRPGGDRDVAGRTARRAAELDPAAAATGGARAGRDQHLALAAERGDARKGDLRRRRPRHTLKGRQDARAVDRAGLRLKLLAQQATAGDIVLLFADESE